MSKIATLYRMVTPEHICPFGLKTKHLLRSNGYAIIDKQLTSREETDEFKRQEKVDTTPQTFIDDKRIGGYQDVRKYFGLKVIDTQEKTYKPVIAIFATCLILAAALSWRIHHTFNLVATAEFFVAISMTVLAIQKLRDLYSFSNQFITYDLLGMRYIPYAYVYPFAEAYAGIAMLGGFSAWAVSPIALVIGLVGAASVIKAVYIDKRELKCACVGGNSQVPLGFVSLTENIFMVLAAVWMWVK